MLWSAIIAFKKIGFLKPLHMLYLYQGFHKHGQNLLAILYYTQKAYPHKIALQTSNRSWTFEKLYIDTQGLQVVFRHQLGISPSAHVVCISANHPYFIMSIIALSSLGIHVTLLNADMSAEQLNKMIDSLQADYILTDKDFIQHHQLIDIHSLSQKMNTVDPGHSSIFKHSSGQLSVMTGGSSGLSKIAQRQPDIKTFIQPFIALIHTVQLERYSSLLLSIPIYHGFGLAATIMCLVLGKSLHLFDKNSKWTLQSYIHQHHIDAIVLVPTILHKLIEGDKKNISLKCIITGGAAISASLVQKTLDTFGAILYNMYGTSETGVNTIATPEDLKRYPDTIGRMLPGIKYRLSTVDRNRHILEIKSPWRMLNHEPWISTKDVVELNAQGYFFIKGRADDMIISGGENIFPEEVKNICLQHPEIQDIALIPIDNELYGQRIQAFVVTNLSEQVLRQWLTEHLARFQMPQSIIILKELPYYSNGKLNKQVLMNYSAQQS